MMVQLQNTSTPLQDRGDRPSQASISSADLPDRFQPIQQSVPVTFNYAVHFTRGLFRSDNPLLAEVVGGEGTKKVLFVIDGGLLEFWPHLSGQISSYCDRYHLDLPSQPLLVSGGENSKNNPQFVTQIHEAVNQLGICRHSYIVAIGGGAVLDMVGYAAATAHRGVRLIRVPTTVLSQDDSAVGVKNGINAFGKKNFLGTFAPPHAVLNDFDFLTTLGDRDWRAGIAEAVKVALIKDPAFFQFIADRASDLANRHMEAMQWLIYQCAQLHLNHIAYNGDPFEKGSSRPLDFGHWSAHKLEQMTDYELRHGEAVAIGIALDSTYSYLKGWLSRTEWMQILETLQTLGFALYIPELAEDQSTQSVFRGLTEFQEHLGGQLTIMLLEGIGHGVEVHEVDLELYRQAVSILQNWEEFCDRRFA